MSVLAAHDLRALARRPGLGALAVAVLGIGIAAPTAMFSIVTGLLSDLPVSDPERVLDISGATAESGGAPGRRLRIHDVLAIQAGVHSLEPPGVYQVGSMDLSRPEGTAVRVRGARVTPELLRVLEVRPSGGRLLEPSDLSSAVPDVVLLSHRVWTEAFGRAPGLVGGDVRIDGRPRTVVGILPPGFHFPFDHDVWLPLRLSEAEGGLFGMLGRARTAASVDAVRQELAAVARAVAEEHPRENQGVSYAATRPSELLPANVRLLLRLAVVLVSLVLVVGCFNVANLLLARGLERRRDVALRSALGASPRQIVSQHLAEAFLLALLGGALGVALTRGAVGLFRAQVRSLAYFMDVRVDVHVLAFAAGALVFAALAVGIAPALVAARVPPAAALKEEGSGPSGRLRRLSRALVAIQVGFSTTLLVVSGLMVRGILTGTAERGPWDADRVLLAGVDLREDLFPDASTLPAAQRALVDRLEAVGGVESAALTSVLPASGGVARTMEVEGRITPDDGGEGLPRVTVTSISPGFFSTLGTPLLRGRGFRWSDDGAGEPVAVVNASFVERHLDGEVLGRRVVVDGRAGSPATIVGVVPDLAPLGSPGTPSEPTLYLPLAQSPAREVHLAVRAAAGVDVASLASAVRAAVAEIHSDVPLFDTQRFDRLLAARLDTERTLGYLFLAFGIASLVIAAAGLFGVTAFSARTRMREVSVRLVLGAAPGSLQRRELARASLPLLLGGTAGLALAFLVAPALGAMLLGTSPRDPLVYAGVAVTLTLVGGLSLVRPLRDIRRRGIREVLDSA